MCCYSWPIRCIRHIPVTSALIFYFPCYHLTKFTKQSAIGLVYFYLPVLVPWTLVTTAWK